MLKRCSKRKLHTIFVSWANYKALCVTITVKRQVYYRKTLIFFAVRKGRLFFACPVPSVEWLTPAGLSGLAARVCSKIVFLFVLYMNEYWSNVCPKGLFFMPPNRIPFRFTRALPHNHFLVENPDTTKSPGFHTLSEKRWWQPGLNKSQWM